MSTPSAAQRLVFWSGGVNGQSRGVRIVIRHEVFRASFGFRLMWRTRARHQLGLSFGLGLLVSLLVRVWGLSGGFRCPGGSTNED